jgi:VWFA-related protein
MWSNGPILAIGLTVLSLALTAQEPAQLEPFRTEVNYIRVDMYPTADGKPVTDLQPEDIEILDEGVPQKIDRFEHVIVRGARSQEARREPATVAEAREAAQDIRARLFVLFLDTEHVEFGPSLNVRSPLIQGLNQMIGGDDLVAVMTPGMQVRDLTFSRRTTSIEALLKTAWGQRDFRATPDAEETDFKLCYPPTGAADEGIAREMILRLRETRTLDALDGLVRHLRFVRDERKAIIAITQGWLLYGDDPMLRTLKRPPPVAPVGMDPRTGRLGSPVTGGGSDSYPDLLQKCDQQRISLSMLQNEPRLFGILQQANAGNTTFYPMDPRGLAVFDERIDRKIGVAEDSNRLKTRLDTMRRMADATDGIAIVDTGNLTAGMQRIVEDLSSYYLIGYYSSTDMDGQFHRLTVRVKRPGVRVRARTGYLASTREDVAKARAATMAGGVAKPVDLQAKAVEQSLSALGLFSRERPLRVQVAAGYLPAGTATIHAIAEVPATTGRHDWSDGGQADAMLIDSTGQTIATERLTIAPGTRSLRVTFGSRTTIAPGDYQVQVRAKGTSAPLAAMESARVSLQASPTGTGALFIRRGVTTGNQPMPTADRRFRRTERIVVEVPTTSTDAGTAQLLNRSGTAMSIPVTTAIREDADGSRWRTAQLALAPLAVGDYLIEHTAGSEKTLTAFRVTP